MARACAVALAIVVSSGCTEPARALSGSIAVVGVVETPPPDPIDVAPQVAPLAPQLVYSEPLPFPARHVVRATLSPASARTLRAVQSVELDVDVEGGALGTRRISAVFVSPLGLAWERQVTVIEARRGETATAHFSLPVASTFIEDQHLAGSWTVKTLDDDVEQASATFALEEE